MEVNELNRNHHQDDSDDLARPLLAIEEEAGIKREGLATKRLDDQHRSIEMTSIRIGNHHHPAAAISVMRVLFILFYFLVPTNAYVNFNFTGDGISRKKCHIVAFDQIRGYLNWNQEWFQKVAQSQNIIISEISNPIKLKQSNPDVVIFHAPSHKSSVPMGVKQESGKKVLYAMVSMEQPLYAPVLQQLDYLKKNFDLMITYSLENKYPKTTVPNLPITYFPSHIIPVEKILEKGKSFSEKTGYDTGVTVVLFTSNCANAGAKERYKYFEELMKYVEVHSYGKCFKNRDEPNMPPDPTWPQIAQRRARKVKVLSNYKFYLAFENSPIDDYVSEKVFEGLIAGTIPVYRGAKRIDKFMPSDKSFINANNLTPRELADLLIKLTKDENAYNTYFEWKSKPLPKEFHEIGEMSYCHPNVVRRICDYAFEQQKKI